MSSGNWMRYLKKIKPYTIKKGIRYLKHYGPKEFWVRLCERMEPEEVPYGPWFENHKPSEKELEGQRRKQWKKQPLISVVVPAYKTPAKFLREMIESLEVQTYTNWELCIANASPEDAAMSEVLREYTSKDARVKVENLKENLGIAENTNAAMEMAAGEYTGLRIIRSYLESIGQGHRNLVLIPASAHGTNPASAVQAGYQPLTCACDEHGNVDLNDLREKAEANRDNLAALMITYPSTHGIFEEEIAEICQIIHACGAQVYMDGANMNAQVGLTNPGTIGADVCHLNLHKTFASPHGGGGPGVGPVCVAEHLVPFLPGHALFGNDANEVSAAPYGSAGILPITYAYICMMGADGLARATKAAILNANYLAACLKDTYGIVYHGKNGFVGHEMILECRKIHEESGISENDIAKRLMDYGYHAPTLSFPVHGTLMVEPTESESLAELDNFVDTMQAIWKEIEEVKNGDAAREDNVLVNAPHPEYEVVGNQWNHGYSREKAAYPIESVRWNKFWINVARVDNTLGDRKLLPTRYGSFD